MTDEIDAELSDIERMKEENQHLKRVIGDQGNQIGDLRKLVTESLPKEDDWDYDPQERELQRVACPRVIHTRYAMFLHVLARLLPRDRLCHIASTLLSRHRSCVEMTDGGRWPHLCYLLRITH